MKRAPPMSLKQPAAKKGRQVAVPKALPLAVMAEQKKRVLGPELKNVDVDGTVAGANQINLPVGAATWVAPAAATLLNGLVPGTSATTRLGRKVAFTKLVIRYTFQPTTGALFTQGGSVRFRVFYDKQSNAAAPATLDVFTTDNFHSNNNLSNEDRFITICDIIENLSVQNNLTASGVIKRKLNLETIFNPGVAGTIADIQSGSINIMACQSGTLITNAAQLQYYSRLRFVDY